MVHFPSLVVAAAVVSTASVLAAPQYGLTQELEARARTKNTARKSAPRSQNSRSGPRTDWAKVVSGVVQGVRDQGIIPQPGVIDPAASVDPNAPVRRSLGLDELEEREFKELETRARKTKKASPPHPKSRRPAPRTDWTKVVNGVVQGVRDQGIIPPLGGVDPTAVDPNASIARSLESEGLEQREFEEIEARARKSRKASPPRPKSRRPAPGTDWTKVVNGVVQGVRDQGIIPPPGGVDPTSVDPNTSIARRSLESEDLEQREFEGIEARARKSRKATPRPKTRRPGPRTDWTKVVNGVVQGVRDQGIIPQAGGAVDPALADPNAQLARSFLEELDERDIEDMEARNLIDTTRP